MKDLRQVIQRPVVTEKSTIEREQQNIVTFAVHPDANKHEIRRAVEELFSVKVLDVRTLVRKGKARRTRAGYVNGTDVKRALVKLHEDSKIELF